MIRLFLVGSILFASACSDSFNPPQLPDLKKPPYDFGVAIPPFTGGDMNASVDMKGDKLHDLATSD